MEKDRSEIRFDALVYEQDGEFHVCDYIFLDYWKNHLTDGKKIQGSVFKGATGSIVNIITDEEIEQRLNDWDGEEYWKMAVESGNYTGSLSDFEEDATDEDKGVYEEHTKEIKGYTLKENEHWEVSGGGRCFHASDMRKILVDYQEEGENEGLKIYDMVIFKTIIAVESNFIDYLTEEIASLNISLKYEDDEGKKNEITQMLRHLQGFQKAKGKN